jgi:hypothetical protein
MIVTPSLSDQSCAASSVRNCRATGWLRATLALASMKPATTSSGAAPDSGGTGSMPTGPSGASGIWVICTVGELLGTVLQPASSPPASRAASTAPPRGLTTGPRRGGAPPGAAAGASRSARHPR